MKPNHRFKGQPTPSLALSLGGQCPSLPSCLKYIEPCLPMSQDAPLAVLCLLHSRCILRNGPLPMNDQIVNQTTTQTEKMFGMADGGQVLEIFQAMARDNITKTREAYSKMSAVVQNLAEAAETAQANVRMLNGKIVQNVMSNTAAAFDAAEALSKAKSLRELAKLQAVFLQQQLAKAAEQTRELFDLSTRATQHAYETFQTAVTKSVEQVKPRR
jgi:hypothetical protein